MTLEKTLQRSLNGDQVALIKLGDSLGDFAINLLISTAILVATLWISRWAAKLTRRAISHLPRTDATVQGFAASVVRYGLTLVGVLAILHRLGVQTTSIITVLGAGSLAIGLALQGALSNVAAGVMILIFRPYRVGDVILIASRTGTVKKLDLFNTELADFDGVKVVVPNGKGFSDVVVNYTDIDRRRIELVLGLDRGCDLDKAIAVLLELAKDDDRLLADPAPWANVVELTPSAVNVALRVWARLDTYWDARSDLMRRVLTRLKAEGVALAYPIQLSEPPRP